MAHAWHTRMPQVAREARETNGVEAHAKNFACRRQPCADAVLTGRACRGLLSCRARFRGQSLRSTLHWLPTGSLPMHKIWFGQRSRGLVLGAHLRCETTPGK